MFKFGPKSFHLQWHITERCNLRCRHCYQDPVLIKKELDIDDLSKILENFIKQIKIWKLPKETVRISFTGGEPLVKKGFLKLLEKCYQNRDKFYYGVLTNGIFLDEKTVKEFKKLKVDYVQISLEGMEETNDYLRGKGVFKKVIEGIELLKSKNIDANLSMTVSRVNLKDVPAVINLSRRLGAPLGMRRLVPFGRGKMLKKFILTPEEVRKLWNYIERLKQSLGSKIGLGCEDGMLVQDFPQYRSGECSAGYISFTVLPNADVYPCRRLPILAGNLLKESFEAVYNSKSLRELRNLHNINDVCYSCFHFAKCRGGAKCLAFSYFQDTSAPDPQCWRLFGKELAEPGLKWRNDVGGREELLNFRWMRFDNAPDL